MFLLKEETKIEITRDHSKDLVGNQQPWTTIDDNRLVGKNRKGLRKIMELSLFFFLLTIGYSPAIMASSKSITGRSRGSTRGSSMVNKGGSDQKEEENFGQTRGFFNQFPTDFFG